MLAIPKNPQGHGVYNAITLVTLTVNPTYQAPVTLQPDWRPFNFLGAGFVNKRKYKTGKVSDLPHIILLTMHQ